LTQNQREYLEASEEERKENLSRQKRYQRRKAIRQRVKNGLLDLPLVQEHLVDDEREQVFDELFAEGEAGSDGFAALTAATALAFEGARQRGIPMEQFAKDGAKAAVSRDVGDDIRVQAGADLSTELIDTRELAPPAASAAGKLSDGVSVSELDTEEQALVLRYVDDQDLTTDEVDGEDLLNWWMELGEE
jgi:hypothetical protein